MDFKFLTTGSGRIAHFLVDIEKDINNQDILTSEFIAHKIVEIEQKISNIINERFTDDFEIIRQHLNECRTQLLYKQRALELTENNTFLFRQKMLEARAQKD